MVAQVRRENRTAFAPTGYSNWPCITHLASCQSRNQPTISTDEPNFLGPVQFDADRQVDRSILHLSVVPDLHIQRIQIHDQVQVFRRSPCQLLTSLTTPSVIVEISAVLTSIP
jgi:hypothetical protein